MQTPKTVYFTKAHFKKLPMSRIRHGENTVCPLLVFLRKNFGCRFKQPNMTY